jgi:RHS repeat-associated protein
VLDIAYPNGQTSHYSYFGNAGDHRLQQLTHQKPDTSVLSSFTYAYTPTGDITNWLQQLGAVTQSWTVGYDAADQVLSVSQIGSSTNTFAYTYDAAANRLSETTNGVPRVFQYNALNQLLSSSDSGPTNVSYQWDAEQRLVAINQGANQSQFFYDGQGRRVRIVETTGNVTNADRRFVWCGSEICEEHNANDAVVNRYFGQGEQQFGTNLFYTRDHLGSVRELTDTSAALRAGYIYLPFGAAAKVTGSLEANFGFTGHFRHLPSGCSLTLNRAYDPGHGRWLSRDPTEEDGGVNLYAYVFNDPINWSDSLGLESYEQTANKGFSIVNDLTTYGGYTLGLIAANGYTVGATATVPLVGAVLGSVGFGVTVGGKLEPLLNPYADAAAQTSVFSTQSSDPSAFGPGGFVSGRQSKYDQPGLDSEQRKRQKAVQKLNLCPAKAGAAKRFILYGP